MPGATGYDLTVQDTTTSTTILNALPITGSTSYTLAGSLISGDSYQWLVTAFNSSGDIGQATQPSIFAVYILPPVLPSPTPTATSGSTLTPTFSWLAVSGAANYQVDLLDTSVGTLSFVIAPIQVNGTSYSVSTELIAGHTYEWQVLADDSSGNASAWSSPVQFTAASPPVVPPPVVPPPFFFFFFFFFFFVPHRRAAARRAAGWVQPH